MRKSRNFLVICAVTVAAGTAGLGAAASSADPADTPPTAVAVDLTSGAEARWYADPVDGQPGDRLVVCDLKDDGYGAYAKVRWDNGIGRTNRADGQGACSTATGDIANGTTVEISACLMTNGFVGHCSRWVITRG